MLSLFAEHSSQQDAISQYILANGGVPRREKLTHLLRTLQESEPAETSLQEYLRRYAIALEEQLAAAAMVDGVGSAIAVLRTLKAWVRPETSPVAMWENPWSGCSAYVESGPMERR